MELSEPLLDEAGEHSEYGRPHDFVALAERYAPEDEPGVSRAWLFAHVEVLDEESGLDEAAFRTALEEVTTDSETWVDDAAVYELGEDRLSAYPPAWHEALGGVTSLPRVVRYLLEESDYQSVTGGPGHGVPEGDLFDVAAAVAGFTRESAKAALEDCRADGRLAEDVDQHPAAKVYLPDSDMDVDAPPE